MEESSSKIEFPDKGYDVTLSPLAVEGLAWEENLNSKSKRRILSRLIEAQAGLCCYCCRPFTETGDTMPTIEHKKAKMDGGKDHVRNFAAACLHCNQHRGRQMAQSRARP